MISMTVTQAIITVAVVSLTTFLTRALPFMLFPVNKPTPQFVVYLGRVLPFAITSMLIVYCLKDAAVLTWPFALPEIIAIAVVVGLYLLFKNSLVAIATGTIIYMVLVQLVFAR